MFGKNKKHAHDDIDMTGKSPAIRQSICTGEKVAGFIDDTTKHFEEAVLIRGESDLLSFMAKYGIKDRNAIKTFY